ncbi:MAG: DUF2782 domain-containing protein [Betaproteobacteria bacterium]
MRHLLAIVLLAAALPLYAQQRPALEPVPAPPPDPGFNFDAALDAPSIVIKRRDVQEIEEATSPLDGKKSVTVTSPIGTTYHLNEDLGDGAPTRSGNDSGLRVPTWQIFSF